MPQPQPSSRPEALTQLAALRERLSEGNEGFALATRLEKDAEAFCAGIRAELKSLREGHQLTQKQLAELLELSQSAISKIENGSGDLSLKMVFRISAALDASPAMDFPRASQAAQPAQVDQAAMAAMVGVIQEDLVRRIPGIVEAAAAKLSSAG